MREKGQELKVPHKHLDESHLFGLTVRHERKLNETSAEAVSTSDNKKALNVRQKENETSRRECLMNQRKLSSDVYAHSSIGNFFLWKG